MTGFVPDEGETLRGQMVWKRSLVDRDAGLELGLFTNVAPGETIAEAALTEPAGGSYARIALNDANWVDADDAGDRKFSYPQQTFQAVGGAMAASPEEQRAADLRSMAAQQDGAGRSPAERPI